MATDYWTSPLMMIAREQMRLGAHVFPLKSMEEWIRILQDKNACSQKPSPDDASAETIALLKQTKQQVFASCCVLLARDTLSARLHAAIAHVSPPLNTMRAA